MKPLVIVGAGGHGRVVLDCCRSSGVMVAGFVDSVQTAGTVIHGVKVLGDNALLSDTDFLKTHSFIVAIGNQQARRDLSQQIIANGGELTSVIHSTAILSPQASIGKGTVIVAGAVVNTDAKIGDYCIVNTAATIDHDVVLENGVQICPGVNLAGGVKCGEGVFIGTGAVVVPGITIGANTRIGAGAVVLGDIPANMLAVGNPAQIKL